MDITDYTISELLQYIVGRELSYVSIGRRKSDDLLLVTIGVVPDGRLYASGSDAIAVTHDALSLLRFVLSARPGEIALAIREQREDFTGGRSGDSTLVKRTSYAGTKQLEDPHPF